MSSHYQKICQLFLRGKCSDDMCPDSHQHQNRPQGVQEFQRQPKRDFGQSRNRDASYDNNGEGYEGNEKQSKGGICKFYLMYGNCKFGDSCKNSHILQGENEEKADFKRGDKGQKNWQHYEDENANELGNEQTKKQICNHFVKFGKCKFGDQCNYIHQQPGQQGDDAETKRGQKNWQHHDDENDNEGYGEQPKKGICNHFKKFGKCKYGDQCTFIHEQPEQQGDDAEIKRGDRGQKNMYDNQDDNQNEKYQSQKLKKGICNHFKQYGKCKFEDKCRFSHDLQGEQEDEVEIDDDNEDEEEQPNPPRKQAICKNFSQFGSCKFGDQCKFLHDGVQQNENGINQDGEKKETKKPCTNFKQYGKCSYEDKCKYSHILENEQDQFQPQQNSESQPQKRICQFFQQGNCNKGNDCKFAHDLPKDQLISNVGTSKIEEEKNILKNQSFKFSLLELGASNKLINPKEVFTIGRRKIVVFYENGLLLLRMISKKAKEFLEAQKKIKAQQEQKIDEIESDKMNKNVDVSQKGLILEVLERYDYPIKKVIADKVFLKSQRWAVVTFQNKINLSYGYILMDLNSCYQRDSFFKQCAVIDIAHADQIKSVEFCLSQNKYDDIEQQLQFQLKEEQADIQSDSILESDDPLMSFKEKRLLKEKQKREQLIKKINKNINKLQSKIVEDSKKLNKQNQQSLPEQTMELSQKQIQISQESQQQQHSQEQLENDKEIVLKFLSSTSQQNEEKSNSQADSKQIQNSNKDINEKQQNGQSDSNFKELESILSRDNLLLQKYNQIKKLYEYQLEQIENEYNQLDQPDISPTQKGETLEEGRVILYEDEEDQIDKIEDELAKEAWKEEEKSIIPSSDLADKFCFEDIYLESEHATCLSDLILFTSSNDKMLKVWEIEAKQNNEEILPPNKFSFQQSNLDNQQEKKKRLDSQFIFKVTLNEEKSLQITNKILNHSVISSMIQLILPQKNPLKQELEFNRLLLLGGETGEMYSVGLNCSLSKVSQIGEKDKKIEEFLVSDQNQIFTVLNGGGKGQIAQIGHDSSYLVQTTDQGNIDCLYSELDEEKDKIMLFYGNNNFLVGLHASLNERLIIVSQEEQELKKKMEEAQEEVNQEIPIEKQDENQNKSQDQAPKDSIDPNKKLLDFAQPFKKVEKEYSNPLPQYDKVKRILNIKVKNQFVLFAFVINKFNNITQDAYLQNLQCNPNSRRDSKYNQNMNLRKQNPNSRFNNNVGSKFTSAIKDLGNNSRSRERSSYKDKDKQGIDNKGNSDNSSSYQRKEFSFGGPNQRRGAFKDEERGGINSNNPKPGNRNNRFDRNTKDNNSYQDRRDTKDEGKQNGNRQNSQNKGFRQNQRGRDNNNGKGFNNFNNQNRNRSDENSWNKDKITQ